MPWLKLKVINITRRLIINQDQTIQSGIRTTCRPTVALRRSIVLIPGESIMAFSRVTFALPLLPIPRPAQNFHGTNKFQELKSVSTIYSCGKMHERRKATSQYQTIFFCLTQEKYKGVLGEGEELAGNLLQSFHHASPEEVLFTKAWRTCPRDSTWRLEWVPLKRNGSSPLISMLRNIYTHNR